MKSIQNAHYPDHIIAESHALLRQGYSNRRIAYDLLPARFPGEQTPSHETVRAYELTLVESSQEESIPRESRIIEAADNVIAAGLASIEPGTEHKYLIQANAVAGTLRDKQIKRQQLLQDQYNASQPRLVFILSDPPSIEAQYSIAEPPVHSLASEP